MSLEYSQCDQPKQRREESLDQGENPLVGRCEISQGNDKGALDADGSKTLFLRLLSKMWIRTRAIVVLDGIYLKWEAGEGENLS
jgi:hypothetical protein